MPPENSLLNIPEVGFTVMCRNSGSGSSDVLRFREESNHHMDLDEEDVENQDPSDNILSPESYSPFVAPEDMLVVPKDDDSIGEEVVSSPPAAHVSYEEIVHVEISEGTNEEEEQPRSKGGGPEGLSGILFVLTQWTLTLQEVYQERIQANCGLKSHPGSKCVCNKTASITKELQGLQNRLTEKYYLYSSAPKSNHLVISSEEKDLLRIQTLINAHVSIQISRPSDEAVYEARRLVRDIEEPTQYLSALIRNLIGIVKGLLPCGSGRHFECTEGESFPKEGGVMEQDEEEDMSLRVASMSTSPSKSRKRTLKGPSISPAAPSSLASPSKKPRKGAEDNSFRLRPLDILEKNKKLPKTNGLYQFVLWREALKAEKDRVVILSPSPGVSSGKSHNKRLSFDM